MGTATNEDELIELERQYWQALKERNLEAVQRLTEDPCILTGAQGASTIDKASYAKLMENDCWSIERFELSSPHVRFLTADVAIIAYQVREELLVDGKPLTLQAADSSTWVRRDGQWRCALHTESLAGDPLGRDKVVKPPVSPTLADQDAVANLAVKDLKSARKFYEDTVGLTVVGGEGQELIVFRSGSSTLNVYRSEYAGTNQATAVTWMVNDVDDTVRSLKARGIQFEHYDLPELELRGDVHVSEQMKVAWFKDPDGNILNIVSR